MIPANFLHDLEAMIAARKLQVHVGGDGAEHFLVPASYNLQTIERADKRLFRIEQKPELHTVESFVAYVNTYKTPATRLFARVAQGRGVPASFHALFDYHGAAEGDAAGKPNHLEHCAKFAPAYAEEWKTWNAAAARGAMKQVEFAEFIEENRRDIRFPDAAVLLDLVSKFKAKKNVDFDSVTYQPNGNIKLEYNEETKPIGPAGQPVTVPETLTIGIPVFFKGAPFEINVFLRYRVDKGVTFSIKLDRPDYVETSAFDLLAEQVRTETGLEIWLGSPTAPRPQ